jgi:transposase
MSGGMLIPPGPIRVLVATKPVDFRKGMDGLAALVKEQLKGDPFSGVIFCFRSKRADRVKLIFWDGTGLCLFAKRLEGGKVPLAAHRGRRDAAVGSAIGGVDRGSGLDARTGAARACTRSCAVACGEVNQAPVWLWQIACNVLCLARETVG